MKGSSSLLLLIWCCCCLLTTVISHPEPVQPQVQPQLQPRSNGFSFLSSLIDGLKPVFSNITHKSLSGLDSIKKNHGPIAAKAVAKIKQSIPDKLPETLKSAISKAYHGPIAAEAVAKIKQSIPENLPESLESAISQAYKIDYADLPVEIKTWIIEHSYQKTFYIINRIVFFYPELITGPVLWSLGWTSAGPRAGSAAAALMAKFGVVPSKGAYAYLQSTAMGGYGSPVVQGLTRAGSGLLEGSQWLNKYLHGRETQKNTLPLQRKGDMGADGTQGHKQEDGNEELISTPS